MSTTPPTPSKHVAVDVQSLADPRPIRERIKTRLLYLMLQCDLFQRLSKEFLDISEEDRQLMFDAIVAGQSLAIKGVDLVFGAADRRATPRPTGKTVYVMDIMPNRRSTYDTDRVGMESAIRSRVQMDGLELGDSTWVNQNLRMNLVIENEKLGIDEVECALHDIGYVRDTAVVAKEDIQ